MFKKYFLLILLLTFKIQACSICAITSPFTNVSIEVNTAKNKITNIETTLVFSKVFTNELKLIYDKNLNTVLDFDELKIIEDAFISYAKSNNYMTHISYDEVINKKKSIVFKIKDLKTYVQNDILHIKYKVLLNVELKNNYVLYIKMKDEQNYFLLNISSKNSFFNNINTKKIAKKNEIIFLIEHTKEVKKSSLNLSDEKNKKNKK